MKKKKKKLKKRGSILAFTLITMTIMLLIALGISKVAVIDIENAGSTAKSAKSIQNADAGAEVFLRQIQKARLVEDLSKLVAPFNSPFSCKSNGNLEENASPSSYEVMIFDKNDLSVNCSSDNGKSVQLISKIKSIGKNTRTMRALEVPVPPTLMAYVGSENDRILRIINVTNPNDPRIIKTMNLSTESEGMAFSSPGTFLVVTQLVSRNLYIINLSDYTYGPPFQIAGAKSYAVAVSGDYAFVTEDDSLSPANGILEIVDIHDPFNPQHISQINIGRRSRDLVVIGSYVFITNFGDSSTPGTKIDVIDISDTANPSALVLPIDTDANSRPYGITSRTYNSEKYIYVNLFSTNKMQIYKVTNPNAPILVNNIDTSSRMMNQPLFIKLSADGRYAYLSDKEGELLSIKIPNPEQAPTNSDYKIITLTNTNGRSNRIFVLGNYLYAANGSLNGDVQVINITNGDNPSLKGSVPNPAFYPDSCYHCYGIAVNSSDNF